MMTNGEWNNYRTSRDEQKNQGLIPHSAGTFVPAVPEKKVHLPPAVQNTTLDVPTNSNMYLVTQTTEKDRSLGYLMRTIPLSTAFAIVVVAVAVTLADDEFLSWLAFVTFWVSFVAAWLFGEYRHGKSSPNAVALEEVKRKWDNIDKNDERRWAAWEKATGIVVPDDVGSWVQDHMGWVVLAVVGGVLWLVMLTAMVLGVL